MRESKQANGTTGYEVMIPVFLSEKDLEDILITAFEGGINYWCGRAEIIGGGTYKGAAKDLIAGKTLRLHDCEGTEGPWTFDREALLQAIEKVIKEARWDGHDVADVDAEISDVIVQYGAIGEIMFG